MRVVDRKDTSAYAAELAAFMGPTSNIFGSGCLWIYNNVLVLGNDPRTVVKDDMPDFPHARDAALTIAKLFPGIVKRIVVEGMEESLETYNR